MKTTTAKRGLLPALLARARMAATLGQAGPIKANGALNPGWNGWVDPMPRRYRNFSKYSPKDRPDIPKSQRRNP